MKYVLRSIFSKNVAIVYAEKCVLEFDVWKFYIGEKVVCECNKNTITNVEAIHPTEKGECEHREWFGDMALYYCKKDREICEDVSKCTKGGEG